MQAVTFSEAGLLVRCVACFSVCGKVNVLTNVFKGRQSPLLLLLINKKENLLVECELLGTR